MADQKRTRRFTFGNERFGGSYTPGEFEFNFPEDMSREDFEKMFSERMEALHKKGNEFAEEIFDHKSKKENLKPLSIRVKPHTKEFFKKHSILSPRNVLEMYEEFNNGSEAFINSLIEDEKELEKELAEIQEKLHNARLFKEKLSEMEPENDVLTDDGKLAKIQNRYENTDIVSFGNETPTEKAKSDIIRTIQIYNTLDVSVYGNDYLILTVYTNAQPVLYYFKNEYSDDDITEIVDHVKGYCDENDIGFRSFEDSDI
ncbi:MAG: hypothetical protein U0L42_05065 [Methanobrevibacter sp.]|uniref:hypothetical protein n=1 Tax=Methanobrevibacter sp. TaxID=66852 RepID=UPI002E79A90C|nr:hypothetical protein [Methanobrevibacter sp.]MEE0935024.1 hypothetical protein [Methanobrevibacter sp.]